MQNLVEDFLQHVRNERGQAEHTQRTYAALLNKFVAWAAKEALPWVELRDVLDEGHGLPLSAADAGRLGGDA